jgi:alpha-D-ribose 1-methylphosphonate 5-triphosphate diphosphatase PhnM
MRHEQVDFESKQAIYDEYLSKCKELQKEEQETCLQNIIKQTGNFNNKQIQEIKEYCKEEDIQ